MQQKVIEQDTKLATLESEIESLKAILSSQKRIAKKVDNKFKNTQKLSERVNKSNKEDDLLSDSQLAEILGVSRATVLRWRNGQRKPSGKHSN